MIFGIVFFASIKINSYKPKNKNLRKYKIKLQSRQSNIERIFLREEEKTFSNPKFNINYLKVEVPVDLSFVEGFGDPIIKQKEAIKKDAQMKASVWHATSEVWDDGVINPLDTRKYLGMALAAVNNSSYKGSDKFGVFRM